MKSPASQPASRDTFPPTVWSLVRFAVAEGRAGADRARNDLCRLYQKPFLIYILRSGHMPDAAKDLPQAFFEQMLKKNALAAAEDTRVKLRAFLIAKLQGFLIGRHCKALAPCITGSSNGSLAALSAIPISLS